MWIDRKRACHNLVTCNTGKSQNKIRAIANRAPRIEFSVVKSGILECD
jgi:hypothetical protein